MINLRRSNVPAWLDNKELEAPCICGQDLPGVPTITLEEVTTGLLRKFHMACYMRMMEEYMMSQSDNDEDE